MGDAPTLMQDEDSGLLVIQWPKGRRPDSFEISREAFEALVTIVNVERMAARGSARP